MMDRYATGCLLVWVAIGLVGCSTESPAEPAATARNRPVPIDAETVTAALDSEEQQDPAAAIAAYTQAIEDEPQAVDAMFARGQVHQSMGNHAAAEDDFNAVLRHQPRYAAAYFSRGQTLQAQGKHHEALVSYSLAISVEPRQAKWYYLRGKAYEALAAAEETNGQPGRAREMRERAARNFAIVEQLDPITDFASLHDSDTH